ACHAFNSTSMTQAGSAGQFGAPLTFCDSPPALLNLTLSNTRRITNDNVDFIVVTGDLARHDSNLRDRIDSSRMARTPLLLSLGNNDVYPHNSLAPHSPFLSAMAKVWSAHIPRDQLSTFRSFGWFARPLTPKLTGVSLNTIAFFSSNPNATDCVLDPHGYGARHLDWLEHRVLQQAKRVGHKVLISGHVPPHPNAWLAGCLHAFAKLASQYEDVIIGHLFGHVNLDHFVFLDPSPPPSQAPPPQSFSIMMRSDNSP
ncbi:Metallo-dependent phosphatase-like protein, partial [Catenaria anguillulae PL171]